MIQLNVLEYDGLLFKMVMLSTNMKLISYYHDNFMHNRIYLLVVPRSNYFFCNDIDAFSSWNISQLMCEYVEVICLCVEEGSVMEFTQKLLPLVPNLFVECLFCLYSSIEKTGKKVIKKCT